MSKRMLTTLLTVAVLLAATTALAQVQLVFRQNDPPDNVRGLQEAVDTWNEENPEIQVRFETVPWSDALNQYIREAQTGGGPDVLQLAFVWTRDLASSGLVTQLDPLIEASPPHAGIDDFLGTDLGEYEGGIYGLPWTVDTFAMAYRPDLFEAAGVSEFPDTWEDLQSVAAEVTADTNDDGRTDQYGFCFPGGGDAQSGIWFLINYYLWSHGTTIVEQVDGEWQLGVTVDQLADAFAYYDTFFEEGSTPESLIGVSNWGDPELTGGLARGDCVIGFFPPQTFRAAQEQSEAPLQSAMVPRGPETRISHLGGRALAIGANTEHPEEAWEFIQYLTSTDVFDQYEQYPAQEAPLGELDFPEAEQGFVDMLPQAITFREYILAPAEVSSMQNVTNREASAVFSGQRDAQRAAQAALEAIEGMLTDD